jgi:hypothetical protein
VKQIHIWDVSARDDIQVHVSFFLARAAVRALDVNISNQRGIYYNQVVQMNKRKKVSKRDRILVEISSLLSQEACLRKTIAGKVGTKPALATLNEGMSPEQGV